MKMAVYAYEAIVARGSRERGKVEAEHRDEAVRQLSEKGLHVVDMREVRDSVWTRELSIGRRGVKRADFVAFCRQFATLVRAGIPLVEALTVLTEQSRSAPLKTALGVVVASVIEGNSLSDSFAEHTRIFPPMFIQMVRAGEIGGTLDEVLETTATYEERQHEIAEKIKSAMVYPISVSVFAIVVSIFLLVRVIPTFVTVFQAQHLTLPLPTRIVLGFSFFMTHRWYLVLAILAAIGVAIYWLYRNPKNLYLRDKYMLRIPVFGELMQKSAVARTARTMSMLFHSAIPALQAITITADVVHNRYISNTLRDARDNLSGGGSISEGLRESDAFPPMLTQMIRIGEQTGNLDEMLGKVADFYESDVETMVDRLRQLIEPIMIAILAVIVGTIVLSALLPMFSLYQGLDSTA